MRENFVGMIEAIKAERGGEGFGKLWASIVRTMLSKSYYLEHEDKERRLCTFHFGERWTNTRAHTLQAIRSSALKKIKRDDGKNGHGHVAFQTRRQKSAV